MAAGVSKATLFFHFGSRLDLLEEVAATVYGRGSRRRDPAPRASSVVPRHLLRTWQTLPETRLIWEIGDVLTVEGRTAPTAAYRHLTGYLVDRLIEDGVGSDTAHRAACRGRRPRDLCSSPAASRYSEAEDGDSRRFREDVSTLIAPHLEAA